MKDFETWNRLKQKIDADDALPTFKEREVRWCSIGMNIGFEIYGKGDDYWRPVLIPEKHNRHTFFGIPFGSSMREQNPYHLPLVIRGREGGLILSQGRTLSSKRLSNIITTLSEEKFREVRAAFAALFLK
jgi:mRNA interferase MazF